VPGEFTSTPTILRMKRSASENLNACSTSCLQKHKVR
jgi:hypothetical protein